MGRDKSQEIDRADLDGCLGGLAHRLRTWGWALRGMAVDEGEGPPGQGIIYQLASDLDLAARRLELLRDHLCQACRMLGVIDRVCIEGTTESKMK